MRICRIGFVLSVALALGACGDKNKGESTMPAGGGDEMAAKKDDRSLYDRLGGKDAITVVVEDFVGNVAANDKISHYFKNTDIPRLKLLLVEQICEATGGPCKYTGKDMRTVHTGMKISDEEFGSMVEDLVKALDKHKVGEREKGELLGALGGMKGDIVGL